MRKYFGSAIAILLSSASSAFAQGIGGQTFFENNTFVEEHPLRTEVLTTDSNLNTLINQDKGYLNGQYKNLENQANSIFNQEEADAAANNTHLNYSEYYQLNSELSNLNSQINADNTAGILNRSLGAAVGDGVVNTFSGAMGNFPAFTGAGGAPASAGNATAGTAGNGSVGNSTQKTNEALWTQNNEDSEYLIQPTGCGGRTSNQVTGSTMQSAYQAMTSGVPGGTVQTGLQAPGATMQYGDARSMNYIYSLGFPAPKGVTVTGMGWSPGGNTYLPDTGTPSTNLNTTQGGGY